MEPARIISKSGLKYKKFNEEIIIMSEIQSIANPDIIKWVFGSLFGSTYFLIVYIFRNFKKDFEKLKNRSDLDHDRLDKLETEHNMHHPKK